MRVAYNNCENVRVNRLKTCAIQMTELKPFEVAIVVGSPHTQYIGDVVMRVFGNQVLNLSKRGHWCWDVIDNGPLETFVEVLPPGTEVTMITPHEQ